MRTCNVCGVTKRLCDFPRNGRDKVGAIAYRLDCKECYNIARKAPKKFHKFVASTKHRTGEIRTLTVQDWKSAMLHFRGGCAYCGVKQSRTVKLTKEHVIPVVKGGATVRKNIIPACSACNCSKSNADLITWYPKQPFYTTERAKLIEKWSGIPCVKVTGFTVQNLLGL